MKEDYISYSDRLIGHPDVQKLIEKYHIRKELDFKKQELENKINNLIHDFEKENLGIIVNFEESNIMKPHPSSERMNLYLFIDLDLLLLDNVP